MCAATAAAVGTAVATVAAVGTQVAGSIGGGGAKGPAEPQTKQVPGFAPATGLQAYTARLLAANAGVKTPGILDWAASGGSLRPDWKVPSLTPREAEQLRFVDKQGRPIPGYSPDVGGGLSPEAQRFRGREKKAAGKGGPQVKYANLSDREEMLVAKIAERGGTAPGLQARLEKVRTRKSKVGAKLGIE